MVSNFTKLIILILTFLVASLFTSPFVQATDTSSTVTPCNCNGVTYASVQFNVVGTIPPGVTAQVSPVTESTIWNTSAQCCGYKDRGCALDTISGCTADTVNCLTSTSTSGCSGGAKAFNVSVTGPSGISCDTNLSTVCLSNGSDTAQVNVTCDYQPLPPPSCSCNSTTQGTICTGSSYDATGDGCTTRSCPGTKACTTTTPSCTVTPSCAGTVCSFTPSYSADGASQSSYKVNLHPDNNNYSTSTGWQSNGTLSHTYSSAGSYSVTLEAKKDDGTGLTTCTATANPSLAVGTWTGACNAAGNSFTITGPAGTTAATKGVYTDKNEDAWNGTVSNGSFTHSVEPGRTFNWYINSTTKAYSSATCYTAPINNPPQDPATSGTVITTNVIFQYPNGSTAYDGQGLPYCIFPGYISKCFKVYFNFKNMGSNYTCPNFTSGSNSTYMQSANQTFTFGTGWVITRQAFNNFNLQIMPSFWTSPSSSCCNEYQRAFISSHYTTFITPIFPADFEVVRAISSPAGGGTTNVACASSFCNDTTNPTTAGVRLYGQGEHFFNENMCVGGYSVDVNFTVYPPNNVFTVTQGNGTGSISSNPAGWSEANTECFGNCARHKYGSDVTFTATPAADSVFAGWLGDCQPAGTSSACTLNMNKTGPNANKTVIAVFNLADTQAPTVNRPQLNNSFSMDNQCFDRSSDPTKGWSQKQPVGAWASDNIDVTGVDFIVTNTDTETGARTTYPANYTSRLGTSEFWTKSFPFLGEGRYSIVAKARDAAGLEATSAPVVNFRLADLCVRPWIQTTGGDVHSNTRIYTPGGP